MWSAAARRAFRVRPSPSLHCGGRQREVRASGILAFILLGMVAGGPRPADSAPITFNTALPVAEGEFVAREQLILNRSGDDPSGLERDRSARTWVTVLGYGLNGALAVFGVLPYHDTDLKITAGGQRRTRSASGFGDLTLFGRFTWLHDNGHGHNFRVAPFLGVKAPTGEDDREDAFGRLPPSVQPGSGSWDPLAGIVTTWQTLDYQVDGQISYQMKTKANGFEAGDVARLDASLQYRLIPWDLGSGVPRFLYGVIEAGLVHQQKNRRDDVTDPDSGGARLFLTPGLQYVSKRWIVEAAVQIPLIQNLNGAALENDYVGRLSLRVNF